MLSLLMPILLSGCADATADGGDEPTLSADDEADFASARFDLSVYDNFISGSVKICGSSAFTMPPPLKRCSINLLKVQTDTTSCPCFDFGTGKPKLEVAGLCPSSGAMGLWTFDYKLYTGLQCTGTQVNKGPPPTVNPTRLVCYDSDDLSTKANPNRTVNEGLEPGMNINKVVCLSCRTITQSWEVPPAVRYDCGCTSSTGATTGCKCLSSLGAAGMPPMLPATCTFANAACEITCSSAPAP
jgi:hypothetical protein